MQDAEAPRIPVRTRPADAPNPALIAGGAFALALFGAVDAATWGWPLESLWRDVEINLFDRVSSDFGVTPSYEYVDIVLHYWGALAIALLVLAWLGALRLPQVAALA